MNPQMQHEGRKVRWLARGVGVLSLGVLAAYSIQCQTSKRTTGPTETSGAAGGGATGAAGATTTGAAGSAAGTGGGAAGATTGAAGSGTPTGTAGAGGTSATGAAGTGTVTGTAGGGAAGAAGGGAAGTGGPASLNNFDGPVFYITHGDGTLHAIQEGTWKEIGMWSGVPTQDDVRGVDADADAGILYFTHGASGPNSNGIADKKGSLAAWSFYQNKIIYDVKLVHGVDAPSYGEGVVYVPDGEYTNDRLWYYYKATDGTLIGTEPGGMNPHDTIWKNGHRYYGGTEDTYLYVLGLPITKVGPSPSGTAGVRPFTVNGSETRAFITWSNYRGFSVGDLTTGKLIKSVNFGGNVCHIAPSHGITISPDNKEVYVMDSCVDTIRAYTATDDPQPVAAVALTHKIHGGNEQACAWDCGKDGWVTHSRDGKYVYVGDSGDVIDTTTHAVTAYIDLLANCRHGFIEMDWDHGKIVGTATHVGLGY
jgi:YVTN family beta-propeller protein